MPVPGFRHMGARGPWNHPAGPPPPLMLDSGEGHSSDLTPPFGGQGSQSSLLGPPPGMRERANRLGERMEDPFPGREMPNQEFASVDVSYSRLAKKGA